MPNTFFRKVILKFLIPLTLLIGPFFAPLFQVDFDIATISSIFSLVFAILVGFFIATATTNYLNFRIFLAEEGAYLISLYNLGKLVQPAITKKLQRTIDNYIIATLDYPLSLYTEKTKKESQVIIDLIDTIEPEPHDKRRISALNYLHEVKSNFIKTRSSILFVSPKVVYTIHWIILISLAVILTFLLYALRSGELVSAFVTGIMAVSLYLILFLLYEVDNNSFLEEQLAYEDAQKIFEAIDTLRYYPETVFEKYTSDLSGDFKFRIGIYKKYPESLEKKIKIVTKKSKI